MLRLRVVISRRGIEEQDLSRHSPIAANGRSNVLVDAVLGDSGNLYLEYMLFFICEVWKKWSNFDFLFSKVKGVKANFWSPESWS